MVPTPYNAAVHHLSVLLPEVLSALAPEEGDIVVDATLGLGGHAEAFLKTIGPDGRLISIEADADNLTAARRRLATDDTRCTFFHANFRDIASLDLPFADVVFADLGLSSPHLDDPSRGFSFRGDGPLDLRFDRSHGKTGAELLAGATEEDMATMLRSYGEVPGAVRLASRLYAAVRHGGIRTTGELRAIVEESAGFRAPSILPRIFQALRIAVNDELGSLETFLRDVPGLLKTGGRWGIISFHSLEDRMVKRRFRTLSTPLRDPATGAETRAAAFRLLTPKGIKPTGREVAGNPRARSAVFRAIQKL